MTMFILTICIRMCQIDIEGIGHWANRALGKQEVWEVWEDGEALILFPPSPHTPHTPPSPPSPSSPSSP
ncbi:MAG: hypothetical protein RMY29_032310 [Nostoc sp. CreGUA01]